MADSKNNDVRILIVDDLESNRFVLKDIITDMGYQTLMAENGVQALKIVDRFMPQLKRKPKEKKSYEEQIKEELGL